MSSYNGDYVTATQSQAASNEKVAETEADAGVQEAYLQSNAVIQQSMWHYKEVELQTRADTQVQMEALRVRELEAKLQYKVDWKNAQNDAIRAEASMISAQADATNAQTKATKEDNDHDEWLAEHDDDSSSNSSASDYWYG